METRSKGKQRANPTDPEAGPSVGPPATLYTTPTRQVHQSTGTRSVASERSRIEEIPEVPAEPFVTLGPPADIHDHYPLNEDNDVDPGTTATKPSATSAQS